MKLFLKNIGMIGTASVEINGITVIAGENNTGKSTVGKSLFSVFNSFYNIDKKILKERIQSIEGLLDFMYANTTGRLTSRVDTKEIAHDIVDKIKSYKDNTQLLKEDTLKLILQYDENFEKHLDNSSINEMFQRITEALKVSDTDIFKSVSEKNLESEFNEQISNIFTEDFSEIRLQIKDQEVIVKIENNLVDVQNRIDLHTEAIYLDDPFILDELKAIRFKTAYDDHRTHLKEKLFFNPKVPNVVDEIVANNKFQKIYSKMDSVCSGDIIRNNRSFSYQKANTNKALDIKNLSTGLKTFVILKRLLLNGTIEFNGTIILDEPEIHLHPEWQLLFAELIVMIHKEFGMHILLNTHSPYFLRALQVYSAKYEAAGNCKYYLSEVKGEAAYITDVSNKVEKIYSKLSRPLQKLEDERWHDDSSV